MVSASLESLRACLAWFIIVLRFRAYPLRQLVEPASRLPESLCLGGAGLSRIRWFPGVNGRSVLKSPEAGWTLGCASRT